MHANTIGPGTEAVRAHVHSMWASVAAGWAAHADFADARGATITERMLDVTAPRPGERVLELAAGPGGPGLAAAERVGRHGEVVISDIAPAMTAAAAERAAARGLDNVRTRELDLEDIDESEATFDVVLCREGLMLAVEPERAAREMRRVLRPGGRVAVAVWGPRDRNPWLSIVFDAVTAQLGMTVPPPGMPGPFSLDDAGRLRDVFTGAGFAGVEVEEVPTPYRAPSFTEWWTRTAALAGPLAKRLAGLPEPKAEALRALAREAIGAYETPSGLEFPGVALVARGARV